SPEGCAGILWKTADEVTKPLAAEALNLKAKDLHRLGGIDDVIPEPLGGAHRDPRAMGNTLKPYLLRYLRALRRRPADGLLAARRRSPAWPRCWAARTGPSSPGSISWPSTCSSAAGSTATAGSGRSAPG